MSWADMKKIECAEESTYSRDMGQMVHNYKRVIKRLGCMTIRVTVKG